MLLRTPYFDQTDFGSFAFGNGIIVDSAVYLWLMCMTNLMTEAPHFSQRAMIRTFVFVSSLLVGSLALNAQRPQYTITAILDTSLHTLTGDIKITYTNYSYETLDKLGIHLWPNAYSSKSTALVDQMLLHKNVDLYRAKPESLGSISGLNFTSSDQDIEMVIDSVHIDIGWLVLTQPLRPSESITFSSPFIVKIPESFSRMGRADDTYQITQWYPHVAVYDENGWHTMPNLELGEYFNDFADYDVQLILPKNYIVGATGVISSTIENDSTTTWHFDAENVIDFAWFTSPDFKKETHLIDVGREEKVTLHLYVHEFENGIWDKASDYAERALKFYSDWLGPYPYPQMSIVYAPLGVGGGMEYPMLSHIGYTYDSVDLDLVIAHEIGHTWLYGVLANNEREHPWLDEGLNSFIESRYMAEYYPGFEEYELPELVRAYDAMKPLDVIQRKAQFNNTLDSPATAPQNQSNRQYFFSAYELPKQGLNMMMSQLGVITMKQMFRDYYDDYQFSHVTPELLRQSFEKTCDCDLAWFFEDWIYNAHHLDYRIKKFKASKKDLTLINKGSSNVPLKINTFKNGQPLKEHWIAGFAGKKTIHLDAKADAVRLYDGMMSVNRNYTTNIKPRTIIPRFRFLPQVESYEMPTIGVTPFFGGNLADGFMPGLAFTSGLFPQNKFKFVVAPMYGVGSKKLRGHATARYVGDLKGKLFDKYLLSFGIDNFGYNLDTHYLYRDHYVRWSPSAALRFKPGHSSPIVQWLKYRYVNIDQHYNTGLDYDAKIYIQEQRSYGVHELAYQLRSDFVLRPYEIHADVQTGLNFVRLNFNYKQHFRGRTKNHGLWVHSYAGFLPVYNIPDANVQFTINGLSSNGFYSKDYMFDEWLGGRNATGGFFGNQVFIKDAGLKTLSTIGIGNRWMLGSGFSVALPFRFVHLYMDAAYYNSAITGEPAFSYSGGVSIVLWKDVFEVYIPILESKDIMESLTYVVKDQWFERISFQANIKLANPLNNLDRKQLAY